MPRLRLFDPGQCEAEEYHKVSIQKLWNAVFRLLLAIVDIRQNRGFKAYTYTPFHTIP